MVVDWEEAGASFWIRGRLQTGVPEDVVLVAFQVLKNDGFYMTIDEAYVGLAAVDGIGLGGIAPTDAFGTGETDP